MCLLIKGRKPLTNIDWQEKQAGFTLIELLLGMTLVILLTGTIALIFDSSTKISQHVNSRAASQGVAREAVALVEDEIRESASIRKASGSTMISNETIPLTEVVITRDDHTEVTYTLDAAQRRLFRNINGTPQVPVTGITSFSVCQNPSGTYTLQVNSQINQEAVTFSVYSRPRMN